ncbi:MAG: ATP-binding protein [Curtobacterium sp.]
MPDFYTYARVQSLDDEGEWAWIEFANGAMAQLDVSHLEGIDKGSFLRVANDFSDAEEAPADAGFPRQLQSIGTLKHIEGPRALLEVGGKIVVAESDGIDTPRVGESYVYNDSARQWTALSQTEAKVAAGAAVEDELPFQVEDLSGVGVGLSAVGGSEHRTTELARLVRASFESRQAGSVRNGEKAISGAMFFGPPGTGKTHLARAIAEETGAQLITISGPELISKWVGATELVIRQLFDLARKHSRSIIFFDEFDTIGSRRGSDSADHVNRQVGQLLATMDGADVKTRPFVIAATNRLEDVDPAFLRPGRFDHPVEFKLPSAVERAEILRVQASTLLKVTDEVLAWLSAVSDGWSPAELGLIWTQAAAQQRLSGATHVTLEHVMFGYERAREQHTLIRRARDSWELEEAKKN